MKRIIFIGGYADSGKTTTMNYFRSIGIHCFSSSELLHKTAQLLLNNEWSNPHANVDKRKFLIPLAEKVLVETFGRSIFAHRVYDLISQLPDDCKIAIETIGGEEFWLMFNMLDNAPFECYLERCNIRRPTENSAADYRQLLPSAITIANVGPVNYLYSQLNGVLNAD